MIDLLVDAVGQALLLLRAHRSRALLTLFGITWGTAAMVALVSWGRGLQGMIVRDMTKIGENLMYVWPQSVKIHEKNAVELRRLEVTLEDVDALNTAATHVKYVIPEANAWDLSTGLRP